MQKYEVKKTVRFELLPKENTSKPEINNQDYEKNLNEFIKSYEEALHKLQKILFKDDTLNENLKIKLSFLANYTKYEFYKYDIVLLKKWTNNKVSLSSEKLKYLYNLLKSKIEENLNLLKKLKELLGLPLENQSRKSELNFYFSKLTTRDNFEFFHQLAKNLSSEKPHFANEIEKIISKFENIENNNLMEKLSLVLKSTWTFWVEILRASLNYYTVNKKPKDYDKKILEKKEEFNKLIGNFKNKNGKNIFDNNIAQNSWFNSFLEDFDDSYFWGIKDYQWNTKKEKKYYYLSIQNAYDLMKQYKAEQKQAFIQFLAQWKNFEDLQNEFEYHITKEKTKNVKLKLFYGIKEEDFNTMKELTKQIAALVKFKNQLKQKLDDEKKQNLEAEIDSYNKTYGTNYDLSDENLLETIWKDLEKIAKERGKFFQEKLSKYKNFAEEYKKVAQTLWRIKANIVSLEKEKIDAKKLTHWALILEKDNPLQETCRTDSKYKDCKLRYLLFIPREKIRWARKFMDKLNPNPNWKWTLYKFESLTLKALKKLCFGKENNTFRWWIYEEAKNYPELLNEKWKLKELYEIKSDEELIKFYQKVLDLESTKRQIKLEYFDENEFNEEVVNADIKTLKELEEKLKKTAYIKKPIKITENVKNNLIKYNNWQFFKVTSYDLQKYDPEFIEQLEYKDHFDRNHPESFTQLWWDFWTEENEKNWYPVRINPELKVSFIPKQNWFDKSRYGRDRFIVAFNMSINALAWELNLSFKDKDELKNFFENFNQEINTEFKDKPYFYWFDKWENEIITMGLFKLDENQNEQKWVKITVYELKPEYFEKEIDWKVVYKNLSYFQYDGYPQFYKEKEVSCLNLSMAKLINWKIYLNGDMATFLKLKKIAGKRKIFEIVANKQAKSKQIIEKDWKLYIDWNEGKRESLYLFDEKLWNLENKEKIKQELQQYLDKIYNDLSKEEVSIEEINNLRWAIASNMVWIVNHLFKKYPGYFVFEDKTIEDNKNRFEKYNITIWTIFERKLLQKFTYNGTVPPNYKLFFTLKDEENLNQIWNFIYIPETNTSNACPVCSIWNFLKKTRNGKIEVDNEKIYKLFGHWYWPEFENSMHHLSNEEYEKLKNEWILKGDDLKKNKYQPWEINWKECDYHMGKNNYWFNYLHSWDDLATYNIARFGFDYLKNILKI